jgi:hypothetical protein
MTGDCLQSADNADTSGNSANAQDGSPILPARVYLADLRVYASKVLGNCLQASNGVASQDNLHPNLVQILHGLAFYTESGVKARFMRVFFSGPRIAGIRPGVSFGPEDFRKLRAKPAAGPIDASFVYVIRGDHNLTKIGVTTNPSARLASLRTASAFPIDYAYIGMMPDNTGYALEKATHLALDRFRCNGEWFDVAPQNAVATVCEAARRCGLPAPIPMTKDQVDLTLRLASGQALLPKKPVWRRWWFWLLMVVWCAIVFTITRLIMTL